VERPRPLNPPPRTNRHMAGNDDIDYLLANRQLLLVSVEPFPAMDAAFREKTAGTAYLVSIQDAIDIQRGRYAKSAAERVTKMVERDLLLDYMANNWARVFTIYGRAIAEGELSAPKRQEQEKPGPFFYCCMVVLVVLLAITTRYALMFAEAANNQ
jgi:hypothetical protein